MSEAGSVTVRWTASDAEFQAAAAVLIRLMLLDPAYISHSEIQWGLSPDGQRWADEAPERLQGYLAWIGAVEDARVAVATDDSGRPVAVCIVIWEADKPGRFATVQDMAVDPAFRKQGVGAQLLAFVEAEATIQGCRWLLLESGVRNEGAHRFFEREGFAPVSHTFAKPIGAAAETPR